jgi:hypothetical protein
MSVLDFARTKIGRTFFDHTMPKVADQLEKLNTNVEALVAELRESNRQRAEVARGGITLTPSPSDIVR